MRAVADQARAHVAELEAALRVAALPARADERGATDATAQAAQAGLAQARWREGQKQQTAPTAALVTDTFFRVGEWVPAGQAVVALLRRASPTLALFKLHWLSAPCLGRGPGLRG